MAATRSLALIKMMFVSILGLFSLQMLLMVVPTNAMSMRGTQEVQQQLQAGLPDATTGRDLLGKNGKKAKDKAEKKAARLEKKQEKKVKSAEKKKEKKEKVVKSADEKLAKKCAKAEAKGKPKPAGCPKP